ncbi:hypothetical protein QTQ03_25280 [Micromonospora sp. WMMA1363]|uniref:hypothetical protein n=1 Tax=Micromonospora sp. WMMA1363 TaxID=3053985 RepID=UPI00259CE0CB|nr:hypothetical protein [Micromonospora sp. WMMA1363]MDM4722748.1 hypothetical protein [Micromonospora sp. WMMA1363]
MIELSVDQQALQALGRALKAEADGKHLRRDLAQSLRDALQPALGEIRSGLMAMPASGAIPTEGGPLRTEVLKHLKAEARLSGRSTGARVRIKKRGPRGFALAARRLNRKRGWRHRVYGRDVWVRQIGKPKYFDDPLTERRSEYRAAVLAAMNATAARIAART